mgnify:CR=1 FL=1
MFTIAELTQWLFGYALPEQVENVPYGQYIEPFHGAFSGTRWFKGCSRGAEDPFRAFGPGERSARDDRARNLEAVAF